MAFAGGPQLVCSWESGACCRHTDFLICNTFAYMHITRQLVSHNKSGFWSCRCCITPAGIIPPDYRYLDMMMGHLHSICRPTSACIAAVLLMQELLVLLSGFAGELPFWLYEAKFMACHSVSQDPPLISSCPPFVSVSICMALCRRPSVIHMAQPNELASKPARFLHGSMGGC